MWQVIDIKPDDKRKLPKLKYRPESMAVATVQNRKLNLKMRVRLYIPEEIEKCHRVLISIHGIKRNSVHYRNIFLPSMADKNTLIIVPSFRSDAFRHKEALIYGNMYHFQKGKDTPDRLNPQELWTYCIVGDVCKAIIRHLKIKKYSVDIFGHSAGAQFVQRMQYFYEMPNLDKIVIANPGWFTYPDHSYNFPYGIGDLNTDIDLSKLFAKKLTLITGEKDKFTKYLNRRKIICEQQGEHRHERALSFFSYCKEKAKELNLQFNWKIKVCKNLTHSSRKAAKIAANVLNA